MAWRFGEDRQKHAVVDATVDTIFSKQIIATALYWTGLDPFTKKEVYVAKGLRDRKMQRALMQFFKPENWFTVREALLL